MTDVRAPVALRLPQAAAPVPVTAGLVAIAVATVAVRPAAGVYVLDGAALLLSLAAAGCALFASVFAIPPPYADRWRRTVRVVAVVAFAATLLTVGAALADVGGGLHALGDSTAGDAVLRGSIYESALTRCAGLCAIVFAFTRLRPRRLLLIAAAVVTSGSFLVTGHVRGHGPAAVVVICALAHVVAAAAWIGGLVGITLVARADDTAATARTLTQFSAVMTGVVAMLLAGGIGQALLYLHSPSALVTTAYGQVLLVKTAIVAGALVTAAANHRWFVPVAARGDRRALLALRMNVTIEQIALVTVLVVTEILMRQNPAGS